MKFKSKFVTNCKTGYLLYGLECWQVKNIPKHPYKMGLAGMGMLWLMKWSALNRKEMKIEDSCRKPQLLAAMQDVDDDDEDFSSTIEHEHVFWFVK